MSFVVSFCSAAACPQGFSSWSTDKCYRHFNTINLGFHAANRKCEEWGAYLAEPLSGLENAHILNTLTQAVGNGARIWIGVHDQRNEGRWELLTGQRAAYTEWTPGELFFVFL